MYNQNNYFTELLGIEPLKEEQHGFAYTYKFRTSFAHNPQANIQNEAAC